MKKVENDLVRINIRKRPIQLEKWMNRMKGSSPQPVPPQDLKVQGSEKEISPTDVSHKNNGKLQSLT